MSTVHAFPRSSMEAFLTLKAVAAALNVPVYKIRRAAKAGEFPTFSIGNGRALVRLSDVLAAIERSREGAVR